MASWGLLDSALQQRGEMALLKAFSKILKDGADKLVSKAQLLGQDNKKRSEKNLMTSWRRSTTTQPMKSS
jgi:hypothetical protein